MIKLANPLKQKKSGLFVVEPLDTSKGAIISEKKYVKFNINDVLIYKNYFEELKKDGVFSQEVNFEDHCWMGMYDDLLRTLNFKEYQYNKKLYYSLKFYVLILLYSKKMTLLVTQHALSSIIKCWKITNGFQNKYICNFQEYLEESNEFSLKSLRTAIYTYLSFIEKDNEFEEYFIELSTIPSNIKGQTRILPNYKSIVEFDTIINDFFVNGDKSLKLKYYPIILWWKLTSVIPIRPNEFLKLKRECCYQFNNVYFLKVPRSKSKPSILSANRVVEVEDELRVTEEIFTLIEDFKLNFYNYNDKFLFSHNTFLGISQNINHLKQRTNQEKVRIDDFRRLLQEFYLIIVEEEYQYNPIKMGSSIIGKNDIEMLQPGDTRHLAFCSMMLQGFNPLTIAQMGGHKTLYAQNHYMNHLSEFCDAYTLMLTNYLKLSLNRPSNENLDILFSKDKRELAFRRFNTNVQPKSIEKGLCYSAHFPNSCIPDCYRCPYFKIDYSKLTHSDIIELQNKINRVDEEIKVKLNFLKTIYNNMCKRTRNYEVLFASNELQITEIERESASMNDLMMQQAILKSHLEVAERILKK